MSKHHNSKMEPEIASGAVPTMHLIDAPAELHGSAALGDGGDVEIARLAYSYWEARGCTNGSAEEDWVRAEREMKALRL
jgi:hypothetical protein